MGIKHSLSVYGQILGVLAKYRTLFSGLVIISLFVSLTEGLGVGLMLPLLSGSELDFSLLQGLLPWELAGQSINNLSAISRVRFAAILLVLIILIRSGFLYAARLQSLRLQIGVTKDLRLKLMAQYHQVAIIFFSKQRLGHLLEMLIQHTNQSSILIKSVNDAFVNLFTIAIYGVLMMVISWPLTLLSLGLIIAAILLTGKSIFARIKHAATLRKELGMELKSVSVEHLSAMRLIHLFAQERQSLARFSQTLISFYAQFFRANALINLTQPLFNLSSGITLGLLLFASTFILPGQSENWAGQLVLFLIIAFRMTGPAAALAQIHSQVTNFSPALQAILDFLHQRDKPYLDDGSVRFETLQDSVTLENVTFHYDAGQSPALRNVDLAIPKGKITAIVGPSGAGKSTLVSLLARLYDCDKGCIRVDGVDLRDLEIASWRAQLAVVSQDIFIFNDTVTANIKFANTEASDEEVYQAARLAQAHEFISASPQGYETRLGDRGVRLSGGQKQRLAIARAMLVDPQLIIYDEATSDLDSQTEQAIQEAIERFGNRRTTLIIAHRLSTIRQADNIVVLVDGQVLEQGTHADLMQMRGYYFRLVETQDLGDAHLIKYA